jgi:hypothetical protein
MYYLMGSACAEEGEDNFVHDLGDTQRSLYEGCPVELGGCRRRRAPGPRDANQPWKPHPSGSLLDQLTPELRMAGSSGVRFPGNLTLLANLNGGSFASKILRIAPELRRGTPG